jgi:iron complex outermembrane receptor protein/outer membrane receptor for ferrienterochelin and colicins
VNSDGFSDVPDVKSFFLHPKLFVYPNEKNTLTLEYDGTIEDREGGDMQVIHAAKDINHQFFIRNKTSKHMIVASWQNNLSGSEQLTVKNSVIFLGRDINTNTFGMKASQVNYFNEATYLKKWKHHVTVGGINILGENFKKKMPDSSGIADYNYFVAGIFGQDDWKINDKLTAQTGLRIDYNSKYSAIVLPRLSLKYRFNEVFTSRLGGGMGYKVPSVFSNDDDERYLRGHDLYSGILTERSYGVNWDINYKKNVGEWKLGINQMFYFTTISRPAIADPNGGINYNFVNATRPLNTKGFETYINLQHDELQAYLGYTYTDARRLYDIANPYEPLSARSKFAAVISNEFSHEFRACIEANYTGQQYLSDGTKKPGYFTFAGMVRYDIDRFSFVFNCENIFDYRQTRKEVIANGPISNPSFNEIWAPVDGRVANLSVKITL